MTEATTTPAFSVWRMLYLYGIVAVGLTLVILLVLVGIHLFGAAQAYTRAVSFLENFIQRDFITYLGVGFAAQMIDGALGMAYGISSTSFLMSAGVSPAVASSSVHIAEVFTAGASGLSHWRFGNIDKEMFRRLALPGAIGAGVGAYVLSTFDGNMIKPYISVYLIIMGIVVIQKAFRKIIAFKKLKRMGLLAFLGGMADASGGGGWGPIVTTTLIGTGNAPRLTIGTVNAVEFFVALTASGVFTLFIGINNWQVIAGLIAGGAIAAPWGAYICSRINVRAAMVTVGLVIIFLSARTLILLWSK